MPTGAPIGTFKGWIQISETGKRESALDMKG